MDKMTFARLVALAGAIALAGAVSARADDVSNPNHFDAALRQKLDLLDHGQDTPGTPPSADVDKGSFPRSMRIPGTNTSIRVYGSGAETLRYSR